jgi:hypothetical protein
MEITLWLGGAFLAGVLMMALCYLFMEACERI